MDLDISELDNLFFEEEVEVEVEVEVEDIPENIIPKPMIKNGKNAKKVQFVIQKPEIKPPLSYDDILNKMGMFVAEGKLHLMDDLNKSQQKQVLNQNQNQNQNQNWVEDVPQQKQNNYIHNKYFNNEVQEPYRVRVPKNVYEYRNMLINDIIQRQKIKQLKSTKLFLPDTNIHFAPNSNTNMNKLFNFSLR
jgi:hypothetical protein